MATRQDLAPFLSLPRGSLDTKLGDSVAVETALQEVGI